MATKRFPLSNFFMDEEDDNVIIEASLPGLSSKEIEVTHAHGYLLIEGEKKEEKKSKKYYREATKSFSYRIPIPANADLSKEPDAHYQDGVMKISFKKGIHKGKTIPIREG